MKIIEKSRFGKLPEIELADFEKANKIELPSDYKAFLLEFNGGIPNPNRNLAPETVVTYILGMHNGDYHESLYKHISMFMDRLPLSTFPVATDPFGNLFYHEFASGKSWANLFLGSRRRTRNTGWPLYRQLQLCCLLF